MGYYINQCDSSFKIKKEKYEKAIASLLALPDQNYSWVGDFRKEGMTLSEILSEWRWEVFEDDSGVYGINFTGEKAGDDEVLFTTLAPFVTEGSYITMRGEEGEHWRWHFTQGMLLEREGSLQFDWPTNTPVNEKKEELKKYLTGMLDNARLECESRKGDPKVSRSLETNMEAWQVAVNLFEKLDL